MSVTEHNLRETVHSLYRENHGWLHRWLSKKLGCSQQAADLAHDTFVRILDRQRQSIVQDLHQPRRYLRVIAGGLVVDYFRRRSLERSYLDTLAALPEAVAVSPEEREIILEALHRIDALLDTLPDKVRAVFLLSQLEGLTYAQIGERLGISVRTIKRHMQLAFTQCLTQML
jgi:RNA polymerase sigma-70 factor (ECF subfamily)